MLFHDLDEDVLPRILANCDIYTVLSCSRVSRFFRTLALSKQLWISLLLDLSARSLFSLPEPSNLRELTTDELLAAVKRLVCGPATWSHQSPLPPTVSRSTSFDNCTMSAVDGQIRLLPGGRHFVVDHGLGIKCCDAKTGECVWTRGTRVSDYSVEMLDEGQSAMFFLLLYTSMQELVIVHVHLSSGQSEDLFALRLNIHMGFCKNPSLSGDLIGLVLRFTDDGGVLVIDWRKRTYVIFNCSPAWPRPGVAFIPGHVVLNTAAEEEPYAQLIQVYTLTSIASRWRPVTESLFYDRLSDPGIRISAKDIAPVVVEHLRHGNFAFRNAQRIQMTLHPSPLRADVYKLILYVSAEPFKQTDRVSFTDVLRKGVGLQPLQPRRASGAMIFIYHLVVGRAPEYRIRFSRTSVVPAVAGLFWPELSYAGYAVDPLNHRIIDVRLPKGPSGRLQGARERFIEMPREIDVHEAGAQGGTRSVHMSSHTVAVTNFANPRVEISYYV
ncbi:hypothetical protein DFH09DRAFT_1153219, partial [Mycena vulgaris]